MTPEQMRKKSLAQDDALRHARYAQADGSMKKGNMDPLNSGPIAAEMQKIKRLTNDERAEIGPQDSSPNASIRF